MVQTFNVDALNQLSTVARAGTLTVAGTTTGAATNVTVNGIPANLYGDNTFAQAGFALADGTNTFTAMAADTLGRQDTNSVTAYLPASTSFQYDLNGNLLSDGVHGYAYDDENQLISITVTNTTLSQFAYDGLRRRRARTESVWQNGGWVTSQVVFYVYDGTLVIQERDGNDFPTVTYTRGLDLSGSMQGAGGIGGLLARTDHSTITPTHAFYHADGNGNVTALVNAQRAVVARYLYDPYGNILSQSGQMADANLYRFSSKEYHAQSGLAYYLYRYHAPQLQRWLNEDPDPSEGIGGNLFTFVANDPATRMDPLGLWILRISSQWGNGTPNNPDRITIDATVNFCFKDMQIYGLAVKAAAGYWTTTVRNDAKAPRQVVMAMTVHATSTTTKGKKGSNWVASCGGSAASGTDVEVINKNIAGPKDPVGGTVLADTSLGGDIINVYSGFFPLDLSDMGLVLGHELGHVFGVQDFYYYQTDYSGNRGPKAVLRQPDGGNIMNTLLGNKGKVNRLDMFDLLRYRYGPGDYPARANAWTTTDDQRFFMELSGKRPPSSNTPLRPVFF